MGTICPDSVTSAYVSPPPDWTNPLGVLREGMLQMYRRAI